jgi:glycosyltransferase involved in cell wall biosynthesis
MKTVSVAMCTYNGAKFIREQINSIINQSYPVYELIIQDDCSMDNTYEILKEYANKYSYIQFHKNRTRKGINENFFSALERATGDYIAFSDQDDIWAPDKLENQIKHIGDHWLCIGFSKPFSETEILEFDSRIFNYRIERLIHINSVSGHMTLIKKEFVQYVLKFRSFPLTYDWLFAIIAASYNKIAFVDKVLVNYRVHPASQTYTVPVMTRSGKGNRRLPNIIKSSFRTFFLYLEIRGKIREWFLMIYQILQSLPAEGSVNADAQKIALYQSRKGFINYLKLTYLYVKLRKRIFHVEEKDGILTFLRAIYFPISCSDYFRYMSKSYNNKSPNI